MKELGKCVEDVWGESGWGWHPCGAKAKVVRDGKPYCGRHDPEKVAERRAMRDEKVRLNDAARMDVVAQKQETLRRAGCFDGMLEALEWIGGGNEATLDQAMQVARVAASRAKGES